MSTRTLVAALAATAPLLVLAGCSGEKAVPDTSAAAAPTTTSPAPATEDPLAGTYESASISMKQMTEAATAAGFRAADVHDYLAENFAGAKRVVYSLKLDGGMWIVFGAIDGGSAEEMWSGPYRVVDGSTVQAGAPPCGPITYGYRLEGDVLALDLQDDDCPGPDGDVPLGELIAQTTIYESDTFRRLG
jgi:hypothetical protein